MSILVLRRLFDALGRWHSRRKTIQALSALDDRMLRDIGLHRSEIPALVDGLVPTRTLSGRIHDDGKASRFRRRRACAAEDSQSTQAPPASRAGDSRRSSRSGHLQGALQGVEGSPSPALAAERD